MFNKTDPFYFLCPQRDHLLAQYFNILSQHWKSNHKQDFFLNDDDDKDDDDDDDDHNDDKEVIEHWKSILTKRLDDNLFWYKSEQMCSIDIWY